MPTAEESSKPATLTKEIWELLNTLSEESRDAAREKCDQLGLNMDKGMIPLDEAYINLFQSKHVLAGAIEKDQFSNLPLTIQNRIKAVLADIGKFQQGLITGTDQVLNLVEAIEKLHVEIWQARLQDKSPELLGFDTKMNQLKHAEVQILKQADDLKKALKLRATFEAAVEDANKRRTEIAELSQAAAKTSAGITETFNATVKVSQDSQAKLAAITQNDSAAADLLAKSRASQAETKKLEEGLTKFSQQVDASRAKITKMEEDAKTAVARNQEETETLIKRLGELEGQIKDQIEKATGFSLFDSFQKRKEGLAKSKFYWAGAALVFLVGLIWLVLYIAKEAAVIHDNALVFWLRLALTIPLGVAIYFCLEQYRKERRLEEEYNFRANISTSLVPYRDLVEGMTEKAEYSKFLIETINRVFTSPTEKVFGSTEPPPSGIVSDKSLKTMDSMMEMARKWMGLLGK